MNRLVQSLAALALATTLSGCVAIAIPVAASSMIGRKLLIERRAQEQVQARIAQTAAAPKPMVDESGRTWSLLPGTGGLPAPTTTATTVPVPVAATGPKAPATMQFLYGSGEAAGLSLQAYQGLTTYLGSMNYRRKESLRQVVMSDGSSFAAPMFEPCGEKPLAIVLDIDETALLNLGYEADEARRGLSYDEARWQRWEQTGADKVAAVPGAKLAVDAARKAGIAVIFNSNRSAAQAPATVAALNFAGLGPAEHRTTLWLKGDDGGGSGKDNRRWAIASGYCVVALVGDQLGDFSDLFNDPRLAPAARRAAAGSPQLAALWGNGWFLLPNPVYGPGLKGGLDDIFPPETRWADPAEEKK